MSGYVRTSQGPQIHLGPQRVNMRSNINNSTSAEFSLLSWLISLEQSNTHICQNAHLGEYSRKHSQLCLK